MADSWVGRTVTVAIEAPTGSFVKRDAAGAIDVVSPVPVPWNYGHVPGESGGDGDPLDAIVFGWPLPVGHVGAYPVVGVVHFVDAGAVDDKLLCGAPPPGARSAVRAFFAVYTRVKRVLHRWRGTSGETGVRGITWG